MCEGGELEELSMSQGQTERDLLSSRKKPVEATRSLKRVSYEKL